jgi:tRNA (cytidine/uridine-2'-O-)-methyltransferase
MRHGAAEAGARAGPAGTGSAAGAALRVALYQPDIAPNVDAILRTAACLATPVEIVEPCGFPWSDRRLRRAGLDYLDAVALTRHDSWGAFEAWRRGSGLRLVLLTTRAREPYHRFAFSRGDVLLFGRESCGVPDEVVMSADVRLRVPMAAGRRSLNVAVACAMVLGEALRQTDLFPREAG